MNILITGASRGIGLSIARKLHIQHRCLLVARESEALRNAGKELSCPAYACDVSQAKEVETVFRTIEATHGSIDVLINNAGCWIEGPLETNDENQIQRVIQTNILGVIYPTRAVLAPMKERKQGFIINISSQAGLKARSDRSVYNASKWAVTGFTKCLQEEVTPYHLRVTGVYPGTVATDFFTHNGGKPRDPATSVTPENVADAIAWLIEQPASVLIPEIGIKHTDK